MTAPCSFLTDRWVVRSLRTASVGEDTVWVDCPGVDEGDVAPAAMVG